MFSSHLFVIVNNVIFYLCNYHLKKKKNEGFSIKFE